MKNGPSFMLKTRRIEYTMQYYRNLLEQNDAQRKPLTTKEVADVNFVDELRFQMTRLMGVSYLIGVNTALLSFILFQRLRFYISIPLTVIAFLEGRNLAMRNCLDRIYFPLEPLYKEIRHHH